VTQSPGEYKPSRRDLLRPVEYVGGAALAAIFTGVVTLVVTRDLTLALIGTGGVFIIVLVALALFAMTVKPDASESAELHEHDAPRADVDHDGPPAAGDDGDHGDAPDGPAAPPRGH
jgi:type IV secretory pathway TrbD component